MKKLLIIAIIITVSFPGFGETKKESNEKPFDFRKIRWGMSMNEVKRSETLRVGAENKEALVYRETVLGMSAVLFYSFKNNKLISSGYRFTHKHTNENDYIYDYKRTKKALIKKYGEPKTDRTIWKDDLYKDDPQKWGFAVSLSHLIYISIWKTERSYIELRLRGDNYKIEFVFILQPEAPKADDEEDLDKL